MIDTSTKKNLYVSTDGTVGPYIMVPVIQLAAVRKLLDDHRVTYAVDEDAISLDGEPEVAIVNLRRGTDPKVVQDILDRQP